MSAIDGINDVLAAASNTGSGNVVDLPLGPEAPTVEDYLVSAAQDMVNEPPKRKRGRPKGSRNNSRANSPAPDDGISGEDRTRAYITRLGQESAGDRHAMLLRKTIHKIFRCFPHKLRDYYPAPPDLSSMSIQQLIDHKKMLLDIIDDADEAVYVKEGFKMVAGFIEGVGPAAHHKFLRWMPGAEVLRFQQGLKDAVEELADEPGEDGLQDDINRISLDFIGWAPSNPYANAGLKLFKVMQAVKENNVQEINQTVVKGPDGDGL